MRREYRAFGLSLLIHGTLLMFFFSATTFLPLARPPMLITFDLLKSEGDPLGVGSPKTPAAPAPRPQRAAPKKSAQPEQAVPKADFLTQQTVTARPEITAAPSAALQTDVTDAAPIIATGRRQPETPDSPGGQQIASGQAGGVPGGKDHGVTAAHQGRMRYLREHFEYIRDRILRNIEYPERARRMNWEGMVLVSFVVTADGLAESITILQSAGYPVLDRNVVTAIHQSAPFPKPPVPAQIVMPVVYSLR